MSELRHYLVPAPGLATLSQGPYVHYGAVGVPPDNAVHLVWVNWRAEDADAREAFEAQPGMVVLGDPWEAIPPGALAPLQGLLAQEDQRRIPAGRPPANALRPTDTVAAALRKAAPRHRP